MLPKKRKFYKIILFFLLLCLLAIYIINKNTQDTYEGIKKIDYFALLDENKGTTYYVSSDGTSEDGTDINNPMSVEIANTKKYYSNDKVLFKRGDIFYSTLNFNVNATDNNYFYIGAYGDENLEKPIISGAAIVENEDSWELIDGFYRLDLSDYSKISGYKETSGHMYNVAFIEDENENIYGNRKETLEELKEDFDFFCNENYIYVKSNDNPTKLLGKIKLPLKHDLIKMSSNSIIENLCVQNTGAHGFAKKDASIRNVYINNCIVKNIGGSYINRETTTRYGNGIEFYYQAENTKVTNCIIKNIYDAGYTLQGYGTAENGFKNNICQNNIFINCTYPIEMSSHVVRDISQSKFTENVVTNNLIINQGKGWGSSVRPDKYQPANVVVWLLPDYKSGLKFNNNRIFNSRALYYYNDKEYLNTYKNILDANNNTYYLDKDVIYFINEKYNYDREILSDYGFDNDSIFETLSDEELKTISSNENILKSNNYDEIIQYYNNFEIMKKCKPNIKNIIDIMNNIKEDKQYSNFFENDKVSDEFKSVISKFEKYYKIEKIVDGKEIITYYNDIYEILTDIIEEVKLNNITNFSDYKFQTLINNFDNITEEYKKILELYNIKDQLSSSTVSKKLNNTIIKYNEELNLMGNTRDILIKAKDIYIEEIQSKNKYENYLNKNRILNLCNIAENIMSYNKELEEEKSKVKIIYNHDNTISTSDSMIVTINHGDCTSILNNNQQNTYEFKQNGSFTFRLSIKGKTHALVISIKNINKEETSDIRIKELEKRNVKSYKIDYVKGQNKIEKNIVIIIALFLTIAIFSFLKYRKLSK